MRVMIVDDSVIFRSQLKNCIDGEEGISVVATAANGKIALEKLEQVSCDLIILDLEMPELSGIEFLEQFKKKKFKQHIIIFTAFSVSAAEELIATLNAGASDFVSKPTSGLSFEEAIEGIRRELLPKILQFKETFKSTHPASGLSSDRSSDQVLNPITTPKINLQNFKPRVVVIGSSTGGPTALDKIFTYFKGHIPRVPILIAQHMPAEFTAALASRLAYVSGIPASEGRSGEVIRPGHIYVAPGDYHMSIQKTSGGASTIIRLDQEPKRNSVRPAVDFLFEAAAKYFGASTAGFVLTGMGCDGRDGAVAIKKAMGAMMIQTQESCVVWGMPGAVHAAGAFDGEGNLEECAQVLLKMVS